jgi:DNA invertase Pin-like site-specific DNA recombinase
MKRAAVYVRVSTAKKRPAGSKGITDDDYIQNPHLQVMALAQTILARKWKAVKQYSDRGSGADRSRPAYRELLADAKRGLFDVVLVWRFDRFARSTRELINALEEFRELGIDFVSHQEAIDTSTPSGKLMFAIVAAFAEFERNIIAERVRAGMENARDNGTRSGKPIGRPKRTFRRDVAGQMRRDGHSIRDIAETLGVGVGTVQRALKELVEQGVRVKPREA